MKSLDELKSARALEDWQLAHRCAAQKRRDQWLAAIELAFFFGVLSLGGWLVSALLKLLWPEAWLWLDQY